MLCQFQEHSSRRFQDGFHHRLNLHHPTVLNRTTMNSCDTCRAAIKRRKLNLKAKFESIHHNLVSSAELRRGQPGVNLG